MWECSVEKNCTLHHLISFIMVWKRWQQLNDAFNVRLSLRTSFDHFNLFCMRRWRHFSYFLLLSWILGCTKKHLSYLGVWRSQYYNPNELQCSEILQDMFFLFMTIINSLSQIVIMKWSKENNERSKVFFVQENMSPKATA